MAITKTASTEPLSEILSYQILNAMKITGSAEEAFYYIEESLTLHDSGRISQFLTFIDKEIGGCGPINIQPLWTAFNNPTSLFAKQTIKHWKEKLSMYKTF